MAPETMVEALLAHLCLKGLRKTLTVLFFLLLLLLLLIPLSLHALQEDP